LSIGDDQERQRQFGPAGKLPRTVVGRGDFIMMFAGDNEGRFNNGSQGKIGHGSNYP
jgi:hypothetical protein